MRIATDLQGLLPAARAEGRELSAASALGVLAVLVDLARPWPLALAVESIANRTAPLGLPLDVLLAGCGVAVVLVTALGGWLDMAATIRAERAAERVGVRLRQRLFDHSIGLSLRWHDATRSGELASRLTTDGWWARARPGAARGRRRARSSRRPRPPVTGTACRVEVVIAFSRAA